MRIDHNDAGLPVLLLKEPALASIMIAVLVPAHANCNGAAPARNLLL